MKISVSGLTSKDLKLPIYDDPYARGIRPAVRRSVKALPTTPPGRLTFSDDAPKMTEAATNSWLAVLTSLLLFAAGMIAIAAMSGCGGVHSIHVPNLFGGSGHTTQTEDTCPVCGEPLDSDGDNDGDSGDDQDEDGGNKGNHGHGNKGKHKGQHKDKNHHVCKFLNSDG